MLVSQKLGTLPGLGWIYDHGPVAAFFLLILSNIAIVEGLKFWEWRVGGLAPWERPIYKTQYWGDIVALPLCIACAVWILQKAPLMDASAQAWYHYTKIWYHVAWLVVGYVFAIGIEVGAVKANQYTMSQELSPSKLYHTFIFGIFVYWLLSPLPAVLMNLTLAPLAFVLIIVGAAFFIGLNLLDLKDLRHDPMCKTDAHMEWDWSSLEAWPRWR